MTSYLKLIQKTVLFSTSVFQLCNRLHVVFILEMHNMMSIRDYLHLIMCLKVYVKLFLYRVC